MKTMKRILPLLMTLFVAFVSVSVKAETNPSLTRSMILRGVAEAQDGKKYAISIYVRGGLLDLGEKPRFKITSYSPTSISAQELVNGTVEVDRTPASNSLFSKFRQWVKNITSSSTYRFTLADSKGGTLGFTLFSGTLKMMKKGGASNNAGVVINADTAELKSTGSSTTGFGKYKFKRLVLRQLNNSSSFKPATIQFLLDNAKQPGAEVGEEESTTSKKDDDESTTSKSNEEDSTTSTKETD